MHGSYGDSVEKFQHKEKSKRKIEDKKHRKQRKEKIEKRWENSSSEG